MAKKKLIIIGGGMAGLVSAIEAARLGIKVTLLERNTKLGKKILVTGNGRCNITNSKLSASNYHSRTQNIFDDIYGLCNANETTAFLNSIGLDLVELERGKIYPASLQASSVVKALMLECEHLGVNIEYEARVNQIEYKDKFIVYSNNKKYYSEYVIIATGGKSYSDSGSSGDGYELSKAFGHRIIKPLKTIVQLKASGDYLKALKGFKCEVIGKLYLDNEPIKQDEGEVLFTEYGLSGPVILQLSSEVGEYLDIDKQLSISIDLYKDLSKEALGIILQKRLHKFSYRKVEDGLNGFINQRLIIPVLKRSNISVNKKSGDVTKHERLALVETLKDYRLKILDTYSWNQAQATKGGVSCLELNKKTMESTIRPGLYFAGEVVDMDGDCGGYNLQWAISSGIVASQSIANRA